jgi:malonate decarboxylase epsilon subunit
MSVLYAFPGQGAQCAGMLHALPDHPEARRTIDETDANLGFDPLTLDSDEALRSTVAVQLSLLIAGVATARVLLALGREADMVAGLSIGAYPAAVVAGALEYADALRLVALRGRLMEQAYGRGYGMTAIMGLRERQLERLTAIINSPEMPVFLANINDEMQMVIAGRDEAMEAVAALARQEGAYRCERLDVSSPSHCALLDAVAAELTHAFKGIRVRGPHLTYLSSSVARPLFDGAAIADDLALNVARQVRWHETVRLAWERGARLLIEMPSGNVLTRLAGDVFSNGLAVSTSDTAISSIGTLMQREQDGAIESKRR